ncbi:hypothetical protein [Aureispira sp. CCB-QB1]|uniref:hypothetical protein n=1 Tax=Aureispira sp. CCB-QB1 TaxID=1313421 RepID=UPI000695F347|nr:hypothetical protein [Aureispira sp. CCB-QB1]
MPIFDTTHNLRKTVEAMNALMGKSFPFLYRIRQGGIGSKRMIIEASSSVFLPYINPSHYLTYSNIEIRPNGILVHIHKSLDNFAWAILFKDLHLVFVEDDVRIEGEGEYILFRTGYKINKNFFDKLAVLAEQQKDL